MISSEWQVSGEASFEQPEGFPDGRMTLKKGTAVAKHPLFLDGVIEFDMKSLDFADTGVRFRRRDAETAEFVYIRADPDCPAANDCVQYAPITHGLMQWDLYPSFQHSAAISEKGWNHVRLEIRRQRLRVFINRESYPSLDIASMRGVQAPGSIEVKGPAEFANLSVISEELSLPPAPQYAIGAPRPNIAWQLSRSTAAPSSNDVTYAQIPNGPWRAVDAEENGLVNLSREVGAPAAPLPALVWLRTKIKAQSTGPLKAELGFLRDVWLFVNGKLLYAGENQYYPDNTRLTPEGRFAPDNKILVLPLKAGQNEIAVAVDNRWRTHSGAFRSSPYGWGVSLKVLGD